MDYVINGVDGNKGLDDLDFVERYAWFSFDALDRNGGDSGLFNTKADHKNDSSLKVGELTKLGTNYRNIGNPEGYKLPNLDGQVNEDIADTYVNDYVDVNIDGKIEKIVLGGKVTQPVDPTKDGYVFKGWYSDEACTKEYDFDSVVTSNINIYSKWAKVHTVMINGNEIKVTDGDKVIQPADPVKDGYTFDGWYSNEAYTTEFDFAQPINSDTTIYVKWVKNPEVVEYVNVTIDGEVNQIVKGTTFAKPVDPIKEGYTFGGWYSDEAYTTEFDFMQPINSDTTIYVKWVKNPEEVEYVNVTIDGEVKQVVKGTAFTKPVDPIKDGYVFKGWYSDKDCTEVFDFSKVLTSDVTIYAKWEKVNIPSGNSDSQPPKQETPTTPAKAVKTGDNLVMQGYALSLIGAMAVVVMLQKKYNK